MHLLAATPGSIDDGVAPVDLSQTPADLVILSAADSELALLSQARADMVQPPTLRLANLRHLAHPLSVDLHLDQCAAKSRLVIARGCARCRRLAKRRVGGWTISARA